jgi:hypothetical protein
VTVREQALRIAIKELGVKEQPPGSNWSPRIKQYLAAAGLNYPKPPGVPWCMAFQCWSFKQAGHALAYPTASVGLFLAWATKVGDVVTRPFRGDLVCYRFDADNWPDHVGIIERVLALPRGGRPFWIRTIEGNTASGNDANGGQVQRRWRWASRCSFVRVPG